MIEATMPAVKKVLALFHKNKTAQSRRLRLFANNKPLDKPTVCFLA
jgi:hypothetical protein